MARLFGFSIDGDQSKPPSVISPVPQTNEDGVDNYIKWLFTQSVMEPLKML